eukprot:TRINITY_DN4247_c1_g1_i1.p2 TRINITY_DN4247_c1_g1~~TRINITY_DN4247_c1_g1_i1.p2  ORF type:complete len:105 (-),score=22.44 TRINITY_DN4247_c1_g1_i1:142-456(-)
MAEMNNQTPADGRHTPAGGSLSLTVRAQDGTDLVFKVKPTTKFDKLIKAYCEKKGLKEDTLRFIHESKRILNEKTPRDYGIADGDTIDVFAEQTGGEGDGAALR